MNSRKPPNRFIMKTFVFACVLLALVGVPTSGKPSADIEKHRKECLAESKVDEAKVIKLHKDGIFPNDEGLQKYVFCVLSKEGIVDAEGNLNKEMAIAMVSNKEDKEKNKAALDACLNQLGTPFEKVYLMSKCYMDIRPDADLL